MAQLSQTLSVLANQTRMRIIERLCYGPSYLLDLVKELDANPQAVIRHLRLLEDSGFLESWKDDRSRRKYYSLTKGVRVVLDIDPGGIRGEVKEKKIGRSRRLRKPKKKDLLDELAATERQIEDLDASRRVLARRRIELLKAMSETMGI